MADETGRDGSAEALSGPSPCHVNRVFDQPEGDGAPPD